MNDGMIAVMGVALAFNILIIIRKFRKGQFLNALTDTVTYIIIVGIANDSTATMTMGTIASALVSLYLMFRPITLKGLIKESKLEQTMKEQLNINVPSKEEVKEYLTNVNKFSKEKWEEFKESHYKQ